MKNITESKETLEAYAVIDYCNFAINKLIKFTPKGSALSRLIDKSTGHDEIRAEEDRKVFINLFEQLIEAKKFIGADYSRAESILNQINGL